MLVATMDLEKVKLLKSMEDYLESLKNMPKKDRIIKARKNLRSAGIIDENDQLTEHYREKE